MRFETPAQFVFYLFTFAAEMASAIASADAEARGLC